MQPTSETILDTLQKQKRRIVLVEDEPLIAILLEDLLNDMGYDVCATEATEDSAIAAIRRENPDLIVADCRLRDGSGIDAVAAILKHGFVPHIFMTGDDLRGEQLDPAAIVLRKPFLDAELGAAIDRAFQTARDGR